jgi:2-C-methyl-D-erythritol 4-phosphate cytidylyltransferase
MMFDAEARCWAILPAAGNGSRMGATLPKQYMTVAGATLLEHSLRALLSCERISGIIVALHADDTRAAKMPIFADARIHTVAGADQRSGSVLAGLEALLSQAAPCDWVLVHDAARPCLQAHDIERLIVAVTTNDVGGILAEKMVDTVKQSSADGRVLHTLDRDTLWRAQTPQMFRLGELREALQQVQGMAATDEASAMEMAGYPVQLVAGSAGNLKVTVPSDLPLAAWYLQLQKGVLGRES